ncbi:MAG: histidine phosphatase family protein [Firmicutes bacterium]|nr:histidine phosphatase family protein [Bacillota bacterium]
MKTYRIYFIRNGLTEDNLTGRVIGRTDVPLIPESEQMLTAMGEKYIYPAADAYFTAPLTRCHRTVELLFPDASIKTVDDLNECDLGDFEGKTAAELADDDAYRNWVGGDMDTAPPNGESTSAFMRRVCNAFNRIVRQMMSDGLEDAVICATGGVISAILAVYGLPQRKMSDWECLGGKGYCAIIDPSIWMRGGMFEVAGEYPFLHVEDE